jgi:hypothetical protein
LVDTIRGSDVRSSSCAATSTCYQQQLGSVIDDLGPGA